MDYLFFRRSSGYLVVRDIEGTVSFIADNINVKHGLSLAGRTGLEPATSGVTGRRSNQLNYRPRHKLKKNIKRNDLPACPDSSGTCRDVLTNRLSAPIIIGNKVNGLGN